MDRRTLTPSHHRSLLAIMVTVVALLATAAPAQAGTYTVYGTCGLWEPYNNNGARMAVYYDGCRLVTRNTYGGFTSPQGTEGGWRMTAPAGATLDGFHISASLKGTAGWDAAIFDNGGFRHAVCPGGVNCANVNRIELSYATALPAGITELITRVRCYASSCTNTGDVAWSPERGKLLIHSTTLRIADSTQPAVRIVGGSAASGGWKRATQSLVVDASDNVGIRRYEAYIDGRQVGLHTRADCSDLGRVVPCPNGAGTVDVQLAGIADGVHTLAGQAVDSAGNAAAANQQIAVDNTPPMAPEGANVDSGPGWRTTNRFVVRWTNPSERFAPIERAHYELCPATVDSSDPAVAAEGRKRCVSGSRRGSRLSEITDLTVPGEGMWMLRRLWLEDAAGNQNAAASVKVRGLGFDSSPPTGVVFTDERPDDPTRLSARATDDASGIVGGAIEARREGEQVWRSLETAVTPAGLTAVIDDERLPKGVYDLRAVAVNGAGLQQGTDRRADGLRARIKLPVRQRSRLVAGRHAGKRCRRVHARQRNASRRVCRVRLSDAPRVRVGRSTLLRGRLSVAGTPMGDQRLEVWRQLVGSDEWRLLHEVATSRTGRFRYRAARGPARTIRFRYPGTATVRGADAPVELRVAASSSIRASRRLVITGEYVTFRGRLKGGWVPDGGPLVELQVYTRRAWRTFAQPRARASGRWLYRYRFETIRGRATFKFRARIRRQADYPFTTGTSKRIRVRVRGL
jgi:hypothetical protein